MVVNANVTNGQARLFEPMQPDDRTASYMRSSPNAAQASSLVRGKGWGFLKVFGKSMFPWIREKDVVFVRHVSIGSMVRGDVAAFERNGRLCVHRVLGVVNELDAGAIALVTKGDATRDQDDPVTPAEFRGKVEFIYRGKREICIASGWRRHFGKLLALISPVLGRLRPVAPNAIANAMRSDLAYSPRFATPDSPEDLAR